MGNGNRQEHGGGGKAYGRFAAMIATSTVVMFGLMYLNTYLVNHIFWSETRAYMALLMGATMAIVMLAFMLKMYPSKAVNAAIFVGAGLMFALTLWLVRSQTTVGDTSYMRAMIPHHSIAIMTSSRANISDPRVRKLADEIIYAQDKEIAEMRYLISDIEAGGDAEKEKSEEPKLVSLQEALSTANRPVLDPAFLTEKDLATLYPEGPACTFIYTETSRPVLAIGRDGTALVKVSGDLVQLEAEAAESIATGATLRADGLAMQVSAPNGQDALDASGDLAEADLTFALQDGPTAGYRGFYTCAALGQTG